jgi:hypothetical protein
MTPAVEVDPSWMRSDAPPTSDTWRWFFLERWLQSPNFAAATLCEKVHIEALIPAGYAAMLRTAAWIVIESIQRDGVSSGHLDLDNVRWARRLGLALIGNRPMTCTGGSGASGASRAGAPAGDVGAAVDGVVLLFPAQDRALLRLALAMTPRLDLAGVPPYEATRASCSYGSNGSLGASAKQPMRWPELSQGKSTLLVRLAKRHVAACAGFDLKQEAAIPSATPVSPRDPSAVPTLRLRVEPYLDKTEPADQALEYQRE